MAEDRIERKALWQQLGNIKKKEDWIRAAGKLGLQVTQPKGGSSHYALRFPGYEKSDMKGFISNVYDPLRKDISEAVFKKLLDNGYSEDDIWKALKML
ncbi:MAG: hypothetical protein A2940_01785 [Candidatus Wildermuthbacteria bacterium RIFCSPLOWO2_01_FULL_48_29]|uniref:Uncharacterized protein n=1 Tax=Candidatus Wildermuthbacteria bacterium RIFCSPLOWO2_01_FULL_48_29 TaxID=1802462 RepID=A0A1G2RME7_9BACT|nr:MAG: hypothetical protein A2940_01785 [Candidatus Wildermuthbacteria bacterium RIFCSPLOWO2_01_FULL_48_29]